ncbi:hypothetical protein [Haloarcula litorea]|uniref:hypothetical protein n=1 Tax=Haloarcula litorea TaxID=3032579 RepID=UPI0023E85DD3|nr:hypothetical protein [Halomicroarcula sp. GDY20]
MTVRAVALLAATLLIVASLPFQTAGFSAASVDRSVEVAVAEDPDAYLGIDRAEPVTVSGNESEVTLLTLTNRFETNVEMFYDLTESEPGEPPSIESWGGPDRLGSGDVLESAERAPVTVIVSCGNSTASERYTFDLIADGGSVRVELERDVTVECV